MKKVVLLLAVLSMLLAGCSSWMDGSYYNEVPHTPEEFGEKQGIVAVANYSQLCRALEDAVDRGDESLVVSVSQYNKRILDENLINSVKHILYSYPIGAYAVENITFEQGTSGGLEVVAMTINYNNNRSVLRSIRHVETDTEAMHIISAALKNFDAGIVVRIENFRDSDFSQLIQDYADNYPELVMELPEVTVNVYPDSGKVRLVELTFTYQSSREYLQVMKNYVQPVFSAARMYVAGDVADSIKFGQLYSFLMERYDYSIETSITPSYSLLRYGVGDSKAFAQVYDAMCRQSNLECQVVSGTKNGEPYYWNIIMDEEVYYHVDLLASGQGGELIRLSDGDMQGYVWDYAAYPVCGRTEEAGTQTVG